MESNSYVYPPFLYKGHTTKTYHILIPHIPIKTNQTSPTWQLFPTIYFNENHLSYNKEYIQLSYHTVQGFRFGQITVKL